MNRRETLVGLSATALTASSISAQTPRSMNFEDPVDNLDALVRIYSANDGTTFYWYGVGRIYAAVPERIAEPLFRAVGVQWMRFKPQPNGTFLQEAQFAQLHYSDDGAVIDTMTNPITGKVISVPIMQSDEAMNQMEFSVYGVRRTAAGGAPEHLSDKPIVYEWKIDGDDVVLTYEAMSTYQAPWMPRLATENSIRYYSTSLAQLNDRARPSVEATRFEVSETPFMPWLDMPEDQPGHMIWRFAASKHASRDEIPAHLLSDVARHAPKFYDRLMTDE